MSSLPTADHEDNASLVQEAERALVQRRLRKASATSKHILRQALLKDREINNGHHISSSEKSDANVDINKIRFILDPSQKLDYESKSEARRLCIGIRSINNEQATCVDRAAAVALQSYYEMSKRSGINQNFYDVKEQEKKGERFSKNKPNGGQLPNNATDILQLLFRVYQFKENEGRNGTRLMPLEFAVMFLQFCVATGYTETAAVGAADLLGVTLRLDDPTEREKSACFWKDEISFHCRELCILLFIRVIPFLDAANAQWLIRRITRHCCTNGVSDATTVEEELSLCWSISNVPKNPSIEAAINFIETRKGHTWHPLRKCLESCYDELYALLKHLDGDRTVELNNSNIDEEVTSSLTGNLSKDNETNSSEQLNPSLGQYVQEFIIDPLWNSENRWENRVAVAAVSLMAFVTWRKRKGVARATRFAARAATAPVREIVDSILRD